MGERETSSKPSSQNATREVLRKKKRNIPLRGLPVEMAFNVAKLLQKKRDGGELEDDEINFLVTGFVDGKVPDYQMSAFLAFVYCKGMNTRETQV
jgi:hypothetical protein